jgi:hypothetical protein
VLETEQRRKETNWKRLGCVQPNNSSGQVHRTVRWCTGQCLVRQTGPHELTALGTRRRRTTKIHRTVRWCTGLSGESSAANSTPSGKAKGRRGYNSPDCPVSQRSPALTVGRAIFVRHVDCSNGRLVHWTVRCAPDSVRAPISLEEQRSDMPNQEGDCTPDRLQDLSGGAPDCPVRHSTEGKDSLPSWSSTAPSCLGAIKGTPRCMEESTQAITKHPKTPRLQFHAFDYL